MFDVVLRLLVLFVCCFLFALVCYCVVVLFCWLFCLLILDCVGCCFVLLSCLFAFFRFRVFVYDLLLCCWVV